MVTAALGTFRGLAVDMLWAREMQEFLRGNSVADLRCAPPLDPEGPEVRALLRANTAEAIARQVFGVPAFEVDGRLFWGLDSLPMLRAYLEGDPWFAGPDWGSVTRLPWGLPRER